MTRPPFKKPSHGNSVIPSEAEHDSHYAANDPDELPASVQRDLDEEKREDARAKFSESSQILIALNNGILNSRFNRQHNTFKP